MEGGSFQRKGTRKGREKDQQSLKKELYKRENMD